MKDIIEVTGAICMIGFTLLLSILEIKDRVRRCKDKRDYDKKYPVTERRHVK